MAFSNDYVVQTRELLERYLNSEGRGAQAEICRNTGIAPSNLARFARGKSGMNKENLTNLHKCLKELWRFSESAAQGNLHFRVVALYDQILSGYPGYRENIAENLGIDENELERRMHDRFRLSSEELEEIEDAIIDTYEMAGAPSNPSREYYEAHEQRLKRRQGEVSDVGPLGELSLRLRNLANYLSSSAWSLETRALEYQNFIEGQYNALDSITRDIVNSDASATAIYGESRLIDSSYEGGEES